MNYKELRKIAQPHIRMGDDLPSNAFLLLTQLHIPFKSQKQCEEDFEGRMNPLYNTPAFLAIDGEGNKVIYFNSNTKYYNFYILHEIAHYILGHENDCPQNEMEADLLACILAAPIENLPSTIKSARDISIVCQIPIDKAEMYWDNIKKEVNHPKFILVSAFSVVTILLIVTTFLLLSNNHKTHAITESQPTISQPVVSSIQISEITPIEEYTKESYYMTSSGTHYHVETCIYLKNKSNIIAITLEEAETLNLLPCEVCINFKNPHP